MKKLIAALLLGGIGYGAYATYGRLWGPSDARACTRLPRRCLRAM